MRSVKELKDALVTEQTKAIELVDQAASSIDTLLNLSELIFTILAVIVGLVTLIVGAVAVVGYNTIKSSAEEKATGVANEYMKSKVFGDILKGQISEGLERVGGITESLKKTDPDEQGNSEQIFEKKDD